MAEDNEKNGLKGEGIIKPFSLSDFPEGTLECDNYAEYMQYIQKWARGGIKGSLIVVGSAGIGKTETATQALQAVFDTAQLGDEYTFVVDKDYVDNEGEGEDEDEADEDKEGQLVATKAPFLYLKGDASKYGVYSSLYAHRNQLVLLDDLDELMADKGISTLLKQLLETTDVKTMQWTSGATLNKKSKLPNSFTTTSRCMLLCNQLNVANRNFKAVVDRSTVIWFHPSLAEVEKYVKTWFNMAKDKDVFDHVASRLAFATEPSCRYFWKAQDWKHNGFKWREMVDKIMTPADSKTALVISLLADKTLSEKQREAKWYEVTGNSRASYYAYKKAIISNRGELTERQRSQSEAQKKRHAAKAKGEKYVGTSPNAKANKDKAKARREAKAKSTKKSAEEKPKQNGEGK